MEVETQDPFRTLAAPLRQTVHALHSGGKHNGRPFPGSPAAIQDNDQTMRGPQDSHPVRDANIYAYQLCISASDHMLALADLVESRQTGVFASYTVGRGVLEASARAWYLIDPTVGVDERVRRYMNEELWAISEARRFLNGLGANTEKLDDREHAICASATDPVLRTNGSQQLGERRPSAMKLSDLILASPADPPGFGAATYRFISATVHSASHGLARGFEINGTAAVATKDSAAMARYLLWPVRAYQTMGDRFLHHYGWNATQWKAARDAVDEVWIPHARGDTQ